MDGERFDCLVQLFATEASRRGMLRRAVRSLAAVVGLATGLRPAPEAEAKRQVGAQNHARRGRRKHKHRNGKNKGKNKNKKCPTGQQRCDGLCAGCCDDDDCGGNACLDGRCTECPREQRLCRGGCIAETACCVDGDCTGGRVCVDGESTCAADERLCQGTCIPADACCGTDCPDNCTPENCNGCCDGTTCREGGSQNFCGRNGVACAQCGQDAICNAGQCDCPAGFEMCPNGDCIPAGGCCAINDCQTCETCQSGQCVDTCPTGLECVADVCRCTEESCGGCCHDDICEPGLSDELCGFSGEICMNCSPNGECLGGGCFCPEGPAFCNGTCCGANNFCCGPNDAAPCCPDLDIGCCPSGMPNACCPLLSQCAIPDAPGCIPAPAPAAVARASSGTSAPRRRLKRRRSRK